MGVFSEKITSQKSAIVTFIEQQKTLAEVANALNKEFSTQSFEHKTPLQSIYEIPRKKSWADAIKKFQDEAEEFLKTSEDVDEKINELHNSVEKVDEINLPPPPLPSKKPSQKQLLKNSQSLLTFECGDTAFVQKKKKIVKIPEVPQQKSKFSAVTRKPSTQIKPSASIVSKTPSMSSLASRKISSTSVKVSPSVRKILSDAKEKHENMKTLKEMPINVVNLKLH